MEGWPAVTGGDVHGQCNGRGGVGVPDWLRRWVMPAWCAFERLGSWAVGHGEVAGAARRLGAGELVGKACCAARARLPWLLCRRRTVRGVAAYFDLITDDGRLFFGDGFHLGFFPDGRQTLAQALDAHTDLVCELAGIRPGMRVLDVGCGIGSRRGGSPLASTARSSD